MEPYTCSACGIQQHDVVIEDCYLRSEGRSQGWRNHRCPGCGSDLFDEIPGISDDPRPLGELAE